SSQIPLKWKSRLTKNRTDVLSAEQQGTTWQTLYAYNRRLKRVFRMLIVLVILFGLLFAGFLYLTVQIGRERDLVLHLEQQINEYESHGNAVSKRAIPWFLGAAFWATNQIFAFYGLASSCKSFTESAGNAALCIWGAISTAATFIGTAAHGASTVKQIHDRLAQNGISIGNWKRDDAVSAAEAEMSKLLQLPVTLDGFAPHHHPKLGRMNMHFTLTAYEEDHAVMTLGFGHKSDNSSIARRESYNDEYFSSGGIDFTDCFNNQQTTYLLNTASDYQQMDRDIECYFPDLANTWGAEIQLYDSNIQGTIGSGSIAAYRGSDHASSISVMPGCPAGVPSSSKCKRA
ncbi:unnamed protein product, partial [Penicillium viridicatum]